MAKVHGDSASFPGTIVSVAMVPGSQRLNSGKHPRRPRQPPQCAFFFQAFPVKIIGKPNHSLVYGYIAEGRTVLVCLYLFVFY